MNKILYFAISLFVVMTSTNIVKAELRTLPTSIPEANLPENINIIETFENMFVVPSKNERIATLYEVVVPKRLITSNEGYFYLIENTTKKPQNFFKLIRQDKAPQYKVSESITSLNIFDLTDLNTESYREYQIGQNVNTAKIVISYSEEVSADSMGFDIPRNAFMPNRVTIKTIDEGTNAEKIIANKVRVFANNVTFPKTKAKIWMIEFEYTQPLRLSEIRLNTLPENYSYVIKFLAQPLERYTLYYNSTYNLINEMPKYDNAFNFESIDAEQRILLDMKDVNYEFKDLDIDGDGISDATDNCSNYPNKDQEDLNNNGIGDICEDIDFDGLVSYLDNCPSVSNSSQFDEDGDGVGNECDTEESRLTEKYPWLPYAGIGVATLVILGMFYVAYKNSKDLPVTKS